VQVLVIAPQIMVSAFVWIRIQTRLRTTEAGRVAYTFGEALDHPLAVHRFDYRDSVFTKYDTGPAPIGMQPLTIYPHTNWRGDYQIGTFSTGETQRCVQVPGQPGDHETVDGYVPGGSGTINPTYPYCLGAVRWAGNYVWLDHSLRKAPPGTDGFWVGSLVHNKRDLTGNLYMRNRYYDAQAGRFTQEDPIGLAGGLNAYGFAAGDPVSYSDPYGLCPIIRNGVRIPCSLIGAEIGMGAGMIGGAVVGGGGCSIVAPGVGTLACGVGGAVQGGAIGGTVGATLGAGLDLAGEYADDVDGIVASGIAAIGNFLFAKSEDRQIRNALRQALGRNPTDEERIEAGRLIHDMKDSGEYGDANERGDRSYGDLVELFKDYF
jgi:RHS repeat-associated protein